MKETCNGKITNYLYIPVLSQTVFSIYNSYTYYVYQPKYDITYLMSQLMHKLKLIDNIPNKCDYIAEWQWFYNRQVMADLFIMKLCSRLSGTFKTDQRKDIVF